MVFYINSFSNNKIIRKYVEQIFIRLSALDILRIPDFLTKSLLLLTEITKPTTS